MMKHRQQIALTHNLSRFFGRKRIGMDVLPKVSLRDI